MKNQLTTTAPVQPGDFSAALPEFGRMRDVEKVFGIKRGTAYNLLAQGKIRGVVLRTTGEKSGMRLIDMQSVRDYIRSQMGAEAA